MPNLTVAAEGGGGDPRTEAVEFVPIQGGNPFSIGSATIEEITEGQQRGGVHAPEKRTEEGYEYTTRVNREPIEATITGWVAADSLGQLQRLRDEKEPFAVSVGQTQLTSAVLDDLRSVESGETKAGAYEVTVKVREVFQATTGTSTVRAFASTGTKSSSGGGGGILGGIGDAIDGAISLVTGDSDNG